MPFAPSPESSCVEIVLYRVRTAGEAEAARRAAMPVIAGYPGFVSWQALTSAEEAGLFADIVIWDTPDAARAAAEAFGRDARLCAFTEFISQVVVMTRTQVTARQERPQTAALAARQAYAYDGQAAAGPRAPRAGECPTATNDSAGLSPFAA